MDATAGAPVEARIERAFVVRTVTAWSVIVLGRGDPAPLEPAALRALIRASAGQRMSAADPGVADLVELGFTLPDSDSAGSSVLPLTWDTSPPEQPLPLEAWLWPLTVLVARVRSGALVVEGLNGRQLLLDEVDLQLLEAMTDADGAAVKTIIDRVCGTDRPDAARGDDLRRRLARLAAVGRVRWYPDSLPPPVDEVAAGEGGHPSVTQVDPTVLGDPVGPPARVASRALVSSPAVRAAVARARRTPFPGRRAVVTAYRRYRPAGAVAGDGAVADPPGAVESAEAPGSAVSAEPAPAAGRGSGTEAESSLYLDDPRVGPAIPGRIPVYAPFRASHGPVLALGMLTASARQHDGGRLNDRYEIRRTEDSDSFLRDLATRSGPAIVLLSNYKWSGARNLELARRAVALAPETVFIHGGPDTPKYEADCERYFADNPDTVHVTVRGEGEAAIVEILDALGAGDAPDLARLDGVAGISYRDPATGAVVRTPDRDRISDLDSLPSPYLTGEFDHLAPVAFNDLTVFETNRGCPYGCTFCDWGSLTLSRIRMFDLERVRAELQWASDRRHPTWFIADANFGITGRDVETVDAILDLHAESAAPDFMSFNVAKNTAKHLVTIVDRLTAAGISTDVGLALQTNDDATLEAVRRTNIHIENYLELAMSFRRRGLPLLADLMLGLPGQTPDSFLEDLQFVMDQQVRGRVWITQLLPNSPMNDPVYRAEHQIVATPSGALRSTSSYTAEEQAEMFRARQAYITLDAVGVLRHLLRYLQWDHGLRMRDTLVAVLAATERDPDRYPLLTWLLGYFDLYSVPPFGWRSFFLEVRRFVADELHIPPSPALDTVLVLQEFLLPEVGRRFPETISLEHDYVAYFRDACESLWSSGHPSPPERRLEDYPPALFTVYGDHLDRCGGGMAMHGESRIEDTNEFWTAYHMELDSPLVHPYGQVAGCGLFRGVQEQVEHFAARVPERESGPELEPDAEVADRVDGRRLDVRSSAGVPVQLGRRSALGR